MEKINFTKKMQAYFNRYNASDMHDLSQAYANASVFKWRAFRYCINLMASVNGYNLKVISFNCHIFTAGFMYEAEDGVHFVYITPSHNYDCVIKQA